MAMWGGLLKWSLAYHDGTTENKDLKPLSKEDQDWLSKAMDALVVDEVKRMRIIVEILQWPENPTVLRDLLKQSGSMSLTKPMSEEGVEGAEAKEKVVDENIPDDDEELIDMLIAKKEDALDELDERVLTLDHSNDFITIGGLPHLLALLGSKHNSIRLGAAQAFSTIVANNPKTQAAAMEAKSLEHVLPMLSSPKASVVAKGLTALGSLVRNNPAGKQELLKLGGCDTIVGLLQHSDPRVKAKSLRLVAWALECGLAKDMLKVMIEKKAVELLSESLTQPVHEDDKEDSQDLALRDAQTMLLVTLTKRCSQLVRACTSLPKAVSTRIGCLRALYTSADDMCMVEAQFDDLKELETFFKLKSKVTKTEKAYAQLQKKEQEEEDKRIQEETRLRLETQMREHAQRQAQDKARGVKG